MEFQSTEPTSQCPYGIFEDTQLSGEGERRPSCCSPVPTGNARRAESRAASVVCTGHSHEVRQKRAGQDFSLTGHWGAVVADGHGRGHAMTHGGSRVINALRRPAAFWADAVTKDNPVQYVNEHLRKTIPGDTINDGSTLALVRPLKGKPVVEASVIGDSSIYVFRPDGSLRFKTAGQPLSDLKLQRAAAERGIAILPPLPYFSIKTPESYTQKMLSYLALGPIPGSVQTEKLGMYSALGHWRSDRSSVLDLRPVVQQFQLSPEDSGPTKFVLMSDGAADMLCEQDERFLGDPQTTPSDIADRVESRLAQPWRYHPPGAAEPGPAEHVLRAVDHDDLSVAVWYAQHTHVH